MFLHRFLNILSILILSFPLFLDKIPNSIMPPFVSSTEFFLAEFRFKILSLSKVIEEKPWGGGGWLDLGRDKG